MSIHYKIAFCWKVTEAIACFDIHINIFIYIYNYNYI